MPAVGRKETNAKMRSLLILLSDGAPRDSWTLTRTLRLVDNSLIREARNLGYEIPREQVGLRHYYRMTKADRALFFRRERERLERQRADSERAAERERKMNDLRNT